MTDQECIKYLVGENQEYKTVLKQQGYELQKCYDFIGVLQHALQVVDMHDAYKHLWKDRGKIVEVDNE